MKSFFTTLRRTRLRYRSFILFYLLAAVVLGVGTVVMNRLSGEMSQAALEGDIDMLLRFIALITGVMLMRAGASAATTLILARFSAKAGYRLRALFVDHFLRVPFARLEKTPSGELLSVYSNDIPLAERLVSSGFLGIVADFIGFVSAFVFLIVISPRFTGVLLVAAVGMLVVQFALSMPIQKWSVRMSEETAKFNAIVNDSLQNLSVVAAYSLDEVLERRYMDAYNKYFAVLKSFAKALALTVGTMVAVLFSPLIVVVIVLALATIDGGMTLVEFIAFSTTIMVAAGGLTMMAQMVSGLARAAGGAKRLLENTDSELEEELQYLDAISPTDVRGDISFRNVSFAYGGDTDIEQQEAKLALDNVSFDIPAGSKVGIVGGSGSGKSTLLKLLLGLYSPNKGEILLGGQDILQMPKGQLREVFAYVPQDSFLFPGSIGENITLDDVWHEDSQLHQACSDAGILDFINTLPNKFCGELTEAAENISGGQRQRIAMARAFYKNAPIILFDEATSSLDPVTEAAVLESLQNATSKKTVIIVAHRESAIANCDMLIVLDAGRVREVTRC